MSKMQRPMMEVLRFDNEDVVAASGGPFLTLDGFGAAPGDDATISFRGGTPISITDSSVMSNLVDLWPFISGMTDSAIGFYFDKTDFSNMSNLHNLILLTSHNYDDWALSEVNGTYTYYSGSAISAYFIKQ